MVTIEANGPLRALSVLITMESKKNMKKRLPANIMHEGPLVIRKWYAGLYGLNGV